MATQNQGQGQGKGRSGTENRGFASMSPEEQREIARMGGEAVSEDREHMAQIGRKGGEASAEARAAARANRNASSNERSGSSQQARSRDGSEQRGDSSGLGGVIGVGGADLLPVPGEYFRARATHVRAQLAAAGAAEVAVLVGALAMDAPQEVRLAGGPRDDIPPAAIDDLGFGLLCTHELAPCALQCVKASDELGRSLGAAAHSCACGIGDRYS